MTIQPRRHGKVPAVRGKKEARRPCPPGGPPMSEYQYCEFLAIDRPLDDAALEHVRSLSSRAEITPTSFVNVYHYGDFRGNPDKLVEKYYDAFLYLANWGTRRLMLRMPRGLVDVE